MYTKSVELWNLTTQQIAALRPGQWVTCGGTRARFCGMRNGTTPWVTHWDGDTVKMKQFRQMTADCRQAVAK